MSTSYSWEDKGRYGSFPIAGKTVKSFENAPHLSTSAVVTHYEEGLYQVYTFTFTFTFAFLLSIFILST